HREEISKTLTGIRVFIRDVSYLGAETGSGSAFARLQNRCRFARLGDVSAPRLERQALFLPADRAPGWLRRVVAGLGQGHGRHVRAVAAAAVEDHRLVLVDLGGAGGQ